MYKYKLAATNLWGKIPSTDLVAPHFSTAQSASPPSALSMPMSCSSSSSASRLAGVGPFLSVACSYWTGLYTDLGSFHLPKC